MQKNNSLQSSENNFENANAPLIKVEQNGNQQLVSARELHKFLEVGTDFTNWCKRMFEYGFEDGQDYSEVYAKNGENSKGGRPSADYVLTLDCAKEIAMLQRSDKGKEARQYFIACEKRLTQIENNKSPFELASQAFAEMARLEREQRNQNTKIVAIETEIKEVVAKITTSNNDFYTIAGYCSLKRIKVDTELAKKLGIEASKHTRSIGGLIGKAYDSKFGQVNTYHSEILESVIKNNFPQFNQQNNENI